MSMLWEISLRNYWYIYIYISRTSISGNFVQELFFPSAVCLHKTHCPLEDTTRTSLSLPLVFLNKKYVKKMAIDIIISACDKNYRVPVHRTHAWLTLMSCRLYMCSNTAEQLLALHVCMRCTRQDNISHLIILLMHANITHANIQSSSYIGLLNYMCIPAIILYKLNW